MSEQKMMREALEQSAQGWENVIELGLLPPQHIGTAEALRDKARAALAEQPVTDGWCPWRDVSVHGFPESAQEVLFVRGGKVVHGAFIDGLFWHSNQSMSALLWMPFPEPLTPDHHRSLIAARLAAPEALK